MDHARWMPGHIVADRYAISETVLFRYSQRGMLGARWDEGTAGWLYDAFRVRDLFLLREQAEHAVATDSFGVLGEAYLAGGPKRRSPAVERTAKESSSVVDSARARMRAS